MADRAPRPNYPHERFEYTPPGRTPWWRRPRVLVLVAGALVVVALIVVALIANHDADEAMSPAPTPTRSADASIAQRTGEQSKRTHPFKGVTLSGSAAGRLHLVAFRARTIAENFGPIVRVHNDSQSLDANAVAVKVTVLRRGQPVATANGTIARLAPGKTVTVEPISADEWTEAKGYTYDVQLDDE
jgi:hypothetical protein